ncbi:MAG TPA: polysaccharide biosynthesis/export family protein [Verrucomicrobiae bacterium]|jgi:polysaccharide export outer membrane protein
MRTRISLLIAAIAVSIVSPIVGHAQSQPTGAASPAQVPEDPYERARQRLKETLQASPQPVQAAGAPVTSSADSAGVPAGVSPANAASVVVLAGSAAPAAASVDTAAIDDLPPVMRLLDDKQKLSPGDRLSFRVQEDREEPKALVVTDSGEVEIPYIGRQKALDKTCIQLAREARTLLEKDYYHRATVVISIDALSRTRGKVYLYGQVRTPGAVEIPVDEVLTVSKVLLRAGGFGEFANKKKVTLTRKAAVEGGANQIYELNMVDVLEKGRTDKDLQVRPDDLIFVPQRLVNF